MTATVDVAPTRMAPGPSTLSFVAQRMFVWSSMVCLVAVFAGLLVIGWIPPPGPGKSNAEVQAHFVDHQDRVIVGCLLMFLLAPLWATWSTVISLQMRRIEGRFGPLSLAQLAFGWIGVGPFMIPPFLWMIAAFRADSQSADVTNLLYDVGWFVFVGTPILAILQQLVLAVAILGDRNSPTVLPRWLGYQAIWVSIIFIPGDIIFFFYDGPFAWNGIFPFWLPAVAYFSFWVPLVKYLLAAISAEERQALSAT